MTTNIACRTAKLQNASTGQNAQTAQMQSTLAIDPQAVTVTLDRVIAKRSRCKGDGKLAFALPCTAITMLGAFSASGQPATSMLTEALIPGLLAGTAGLALYRATKKVLKYIRRQRVLASCRPLLAAMARQ